MATRQQIIDEMNANAVAWWNASPADQAALHARNVQLAAQLGLSQSNYNATQGTWNIPDVTPGSPIVTTSSASMGSGAMGPTPVPPTPASSNIGAAQQDNHTPSGTSYNTNPPITNADGSINLGGAMNMAAGVLVLVLLLEFFKR